MNPEQNSAGGIVPGPANNYDFITNPAPRPKKSKIPGIGNNPLIQKIVLIVGGAVGIMILLWIVISLIFGGGGTNTATIIELAQTENEIARVAAEGEDAIGQDVRNFAANATLTITTQQNQWLNFLAERGTEVSDEQLGLKQNANTDQQFEQALQNNTFDSTFTDILRDQLAAYTTSVERAFNTTEHAGEREILQRHYEQLELLQKQLPK